MSDSITKGLCRYINVWNSYFGKHNINLGIERYKVEELVQRIRNLNANKEVGYVVLICATNKINKNVPENIVRGILNFTTQEVIVPRILPWDFCLGIRGDNIKSVNFQIKVVKEELNNSFTYMDTDHTGQHQVVP